MKPPERFLKVKKIVAKRHRLERLYNKECQRHKDEVDNIRSKFRELRSECRHWGMTQGQILCDWCGYCLDIDPVG